MYIRWFSYPRNVPHVVQGSQCFETFIQKVDLSLYLCCLAGVSFACEWCRCQVKETTR